MILAYPDSQIISFDGEQLADLSYEQTAPYNIVHGFLKDHKNYSRHLFAELPLD